jgi:hypothetical protein
MIPTPAIRERGRRHKARTSLGQEPVSVLVAAEKYLEKIILIEELGKIRQHTQ